MEITNEKYQNIINMMCSEDDENKIVALSIINELDYINNITKILLLKKHSTTANLLWKEHAPEIYKELVELQDSNLIDLNRHLTYKQVLHAITRLKVPAEEFEFYMKDFSMYLLKQIKSMGYDYIEDMQLTIKYKENEQSREPSESV